MLKTTADFGQCNLPRAGLLTVIAVVIFFISIAAAEEPPAAINHWSYQTPQRPGLPVVGQRDWPRNEIDYFTLATMEKAGLRRLQSKIMCPKFEETIGKRRLERLRVSWTCPRILETIGGDDCMCPHAVYSATPAEALKSYSLKLQRAIR